MCEAMGNDDVPIERVVRDLALDAKSGQNPFFRVAISVQPPMPKLDFPWTVTTMDIDSGGSPWDFYLAFIEQPQGLIGRAQYNPQLFDGAAVTRVVSDFQNVLGALLGDPGRRISQLDSLELTEDAQETAVTCPFSWSAGRI
jgi:hypothetical protein